MDVLHQYLALFLWYAMELDSIVALQVELAVDQDIELGLTSHPLGVMIILRKGMLYHVLDDV